MGWIRHQLAVWRYGLGLLFVLAFFALLWSALGGLAYWAACWLIGWQFTGIGWAIASALVAPFFLPDLAGTFGETVRRDPPPRLSDRWRKRDA